MKVRQGAVVAGLLVGLISMAGAGSARAEDLVPPPPIDPNAPGSPNAPPDPGTQKTENELKSAEKEDSGLGLEWVYLNAEAGISYINMESFSSDSLGLQKTSSAGPMFGLGAGIRLLFLTIGARVRDHQFSAFNLWQLNGEVGLHMRVWRIDPYLAFRGGYAFVGKLDSSSVGAATGSSPNDVTVHGFNLGASFGIDYYLSHYFSIGADASSDFLFLKRPKVDLPAQFNTLPVDQQNAIKNSPLYQNAGSSVGLGLAFSAHLGLHF